MADLFKDQKLIETYLESVKDGIIRRSYDQNRVATGRTIASIEPSTGTTTGGRIVANSSILNTEFGTSPKEAQAIQFRTLVESLRIWKRAKGIPDFISEFAIANNLRKFGSKLYQEGGNSGVLSQPINQPELDKLISSLSAEYLKQASSIILV